MTGMSSDSFRIQKKEFVMQSVFGRQFGLGRTDRVARDRKAKSRRLQPSVDGLERRALMTGGVTLTGSVAVITPDPALAATTGNSAVVSFAQHNGATELDVNLNGQDNYFPLGTVAQVNYCGSGVSGKQSLSITNNAKIVVYALGGSGTNNFTAGSGMAEFVGGSGTNDFTAGSGYDVLIGGSGSNTYNLSANGRGLIIKEGSSNTVNDPAGATGTYVTW